MTTPQYAWNDDPDPEDRRYRWKIERAPATGFKEFGLVSSRHAGVDLHWLEGVKRNVGCHGPGCLACEDGVELKWRGYFAAREAGVPWVRLLEVTERQLLDFHNANHGLRVTGCCGLTVKLFRAGVPRRPRMTLCPVPRVIHVRGVSDEQIREELHRVWTSPGRKRT